MKEYIFEISDKTTVDGGHPSVKKEEIVRCRDCKYNKGCEMLGNCMPTDGFCAFGEKKTDEVNDESD